MMSELTNALSSNDKRASGEDPPRSFILEHREKLKKRAHSMGRCFDIFEFDRMVKKYGITVVVHYANKTLSEYEKSLAAEQAITS